MGNSILPDETTNLTNAIVKLDRAWDDAVQGTLKAWYKAAAPKEEGDSSPLIAINNQTFTSQ